VVVVVVVVKLVMCARVRVVFDRQKGLNTFALRPMCSEAGSVGHLVTAFLTSESIVHNFVLSKVTFPTSDV